ncbi:MAG: FAD-dependent oxidoreductase [Gammaproteobacteria bacterium]|nr:FAD-dependent oxidoreductase [Gammaproteobacteria bacterium]
MNFNGAVVVAGAGAAGMAAAIAAARAGGNVVLLEKDTACGGTMTNSLIHTIGGLYDGDGDFINEGLPVELAERLLDADSSTHQRKIGRTWTLSVNPAVYQQITQAWVSEEKNICFLPDTVINHVSVENNTITSLKLSVSGELCGVELPLAVIDTTGCADVIRSIDRNLAMEGDPPPLAALIFQLNNMPSEMMAFPGNVALLRKIRRAAAEGKIPEQCAHAWIDKGVTGNEAYVKLSVRLDTNWRDPSVQAALVKKTRIARDALLDYITSLPGLGDVTPGETGALGIRDGGRFYGDYQLSVDDVRSLEKFKDCACKCCWPIEYWDSDTGVELEYLESGGYYEIPLRALRVRGYTNLWGAGKCLSADRLAQASARVIGSCWAMGQSVGYAVVGQ